MLLHNVYRRLTGCQLTGHNEAFELECSRLKKASDCKASQAYA